jgi:hypothetical protein
MVDRNPSAESDKTVVSICIDPGQLLHLEPIDTHRESRYTNLPRVSAAKCAPRRATAQSVRIHPAIRSHLWA